MNQARECLVMAKPCGPSCNMSCSYCYYLEKESLFPKGTRRMPPELLEKFIMQRIDSSPGPSTHFEWHGGEPTILGLDYFMGIVRLQKKYAPAGRAITNGLQTNGIKLDDKWAAFCASEKFSVGLSLDGPAELHDAYRKTGDGKPTQALVVEAFARLVKHGVFCNILCVIHKKNAGEPLKVYDYLREMGATYIQFLPLVQSVRCASDNEAAQPGEIGDFLCSIFDRWIAGDVGRAVIQTFDEALRPIYGVPHALCVHRETCGDVAVLEHDGSFYCCDHFVDPEHLIGNISDRSIESLSGDPRLIAFSNAKRDTLPRVCLECDVLSYCNGGCPKDRFPDSAGDMADVNYLCPAYKKMFRHFVPALTRLASHMKEGKRLREFVAD